ncbi:MAG: YraN family protein [Calditerrivibrio sp.]|nr:YraN family protein [Calditerrivibrio sp.]MCA1932801.1 YraN family protein [Calditerrivibrio sp.]MCA1980238.1 YraN family protein [Calditerrivibrio sp.]
MGLIEGKKGEDEAADYLKNIGYEILSKNFRSKFGEIDIIAKNGCTIVFVEVKMRKNKRFGSGYESVSRSKIEKLLKTANYFLSLQKSDFLYRFDVISIDDGKICHIENAFQI